MFTGIIEKTLSVVGVAEGPRFRRLTLAADWADVRAGESISLNGCCLTVARISSGEIGFDVISETLSKTNLGVLAPGDRVHVERSLRAGDPISGHFVQGHIDATAQLIDRRATPAETRLTLQPPPSLMKYIIPKGSVAIDGVSLTIAAVQPDSFEVALIPTTLALTELGNRVVGWPFNLECDMMCKTIVSYLERMQLGGNDGGT